MSPSEVVGPPHESTAALVSNILRGEGYEWQADGDPPALVRRSPPFLWPRGTAAATAVASAGGYLGAATFGSMWVVIAPMWTLAVFIVATGRLVDEAPLRGVLTRRRVVSFPGGTHTYREGGGADVLVDGRPFGPVTSVRVVSTKLRGRGGEEVWGKRFEVLLVTAHRAVRVLCFTNPRFDDESDGLATAGIRALANRIAGATGGLPVDEAEGSESDAYDAGLWALAAFGLVLNCVAIQAHAAQGRRASVAACVLALIIACRLVRRAKIASGAADFARHVYGISKPAIPRARLSPNAANVLIAMLYACLAASAIWSMWR